MRMLLIGAVLLAVTLGNAQPLRQAEGWAIYPQTTPEEWEKLATGPSLVAGLTPVSEPLPNYQHTADPEDLKQLTDGKLAESRSGKMWSNRQALGWAYTDFVRLTFDLGQTRPVGRVVIRFQVISADNTLPRQVVLSLSESGGHYTPVRRLSEKVHPDDNPALTYEALPAATPGIYALVLETAYSARYVRLDLAAHGHIVTDEIAVLGAPGAVEKLPAPPPAGQKEWRDNVFDRRDQYRQLIAPGNLIQGQALRYAPQPNYRLTTDANDPVNLTDGKFGDRTDEKIWFEPLAVGWQGAPVVTIFADLGTVQPLAGVVGRFLGGKEQGGLNFPDELRVLLSADGQEYYQVVARHKRGLDDASAEAYDLPEEKVAWVHNFMLPVGLQARYVALQVAHQQQFICADEVAVVKGNTDLPAFTPDKGKRVTIVTSGVAFETVAVDKLPVATMPLRAKLAVQDARSGQAYRSACTLVMDLPETLKLAVPQVAGEAVTHDGRAFQRYRFKVNRGEIQDEVFLQSLLSDGKTDVLYTYGDSGQGLENERRLTWQSLVIPAARLPKRLRVSLAWMHSEGLAGVWPDFYRAVKHLGFMGIGFFPRYWTETSAPVAVAIAAEARRHGLAIIQNESPAGALSGDRKNPEVNSQLADGPGHEACPSYRGQYYRKEHESFAQHAAQLQPDYLFYDIEAYWTGAVQEASRCSRCQERFKAGRFENWDQFRMAMGKEIHVDMKAAIEAARQQAGVQRPIIYGSYRTEAINTLNDGLFNFLELYPDLLQMAMPSLYVAGNPMKVAESVKANRALMKTNDIVPWLSAGCYGEFDPVRLRDMILEAFGNGANGITYYHYGDFDPGHFKYHAQAVDLVAPIEDIFMDGQPLMGLKCDNPKIKLCGMGAGEEKAVLVSNYQGLKPDTIIKVTVPVKGTVGVYDMDSGTLIAQIKPGKSFELIVGDRRTQLYYIGQKYVAKVKRP